MTLIANLPLRGSQLIEASAGTGKTYTIALLYVRLVLGHGNPNDPDQPGDSGFDRPLIPPEILVVTFTEAATAELRARIRERLVSAAAAFRADPEALAQDPDPDPDPGPEDPLVLLRNSYAPALWPTCARRLQLAAEWMDDAAVSTIHGWALKMLAEHAFDSGNLFRQALVPDQTERLHDAVADYWRVRFYPLDALRASIVHACFANPAALLRALRKPLARTDAQLHHAGRPLTAESFEECLEELASAHAVHRGAEAAARACFRADPAGVRSVLEALRPGLHGGTYRGVNDDATFSEWLEAMDAWSAGAVALPLIAKFGSTRLRLKQGFEVPAHPFFVLIDAWQDGDPREHDAAERLRPAILADAREWVAAHIERQLDERAEMGFDELLVRLDRALAGPKRELLAARIRAQFPVAMIDEFQDTDPVQYRIFDRIYRLAANDTDTAVILIGDPKQAIYSFRGADIHTYLDARRATAGRHHSLTRNFRSTAAMVAAVNRLFVTAEAFTRGAFRFRQDDDDRLPFVAVDAAGRREVLHLDGGPAPALTAWHHDQRVNKGTHQALLAEHAAEHISGWLRDGQTGSAGFHRDDGSFEALEPRHIAVLVRDGNEAAAIRTALRTRRVTSVYLSDRESLFASREAQDLLAWLHACAEPDDDRRVRTALATHTLALTLAELDTLRRDELAWEAQQQRFVDYRRRWTRQGVLPMLRRLIHDFALPPRLLGQDDGERRMTNLLHLAEWAQEAGETVDGEHALIRSLAEHVEVPDNDEQILRLESDAELVTVVTIHKAKGLEYPLVVLPFASVWREVKPKHREALYHGSDRRTRLELADAKLAPEAYIAADDERLSEDMRLLYVALTRARHATFVGVAPLAPGSSMDKPQPIALHRGGLGYLLRGGAVFDDERALIASLEALAEGCPHIRLVPVEVDPAITRYHPPSDPRLERPARVPTHAPFAPWWIASYSALKSAPAEGVALEPETAQNAIRSEELSDAELEPPTGVTPGAAPARDTIHAFPRGPEPGTFLHELLEWAGDDSFAATLADPAREAYIERRCRQRGWQSHAGTVDRWLEAFLATPLLDAPSFVLAELEARQYKVEQDFHFAVSAAETRSIDRLIAGYILPGRARPALAHQVLNGLLKGFIDLLAEHAGQYYVIDWKSNYLGPDDRHYTEHAMQHALLAKRYDAQASLYLLALHRHLGRRLPDYDYDRHIGGALFVFLRGTASETRGVVSIKPPRAFIEALDATMAGGAEHARSS